MKSDKKYFNYLMKRSLLSLIYRYFFLYPKICKYLFGEVLDIGSGIGDFVNYRKNTKGVDINKEAVNYCKSLQLDVTLISGNSLPFRSKSFDGVVLDNVLEHIADPKIILSEIFRVLKNEGILLIGVPGINGFKSDDDHKIFYDENKIKKFGKKNNLSLIKIFFSPFKSSFLDRNCSFYCMYAVFKKIC